MENARAKMSRNEIAGAYGTKNVILSLLKFIIMPERNSKYPRAKKAASSEIRSI
jgi:hypothetical protein